MPMRCLEMIKVTIFNIHTEFFNFRNILGFKPKKVILFSKFCKKSRKKIENWLQKVKPTILTRLFYPYKRIYLFCLVLNQASLCSKFLIKKGRGFSCSKMSAIEERIHSYLNLERTLFSYIKSKVNWQSASLEFVETALFILW